MKRLALVCAALAAGLFTAAPAKADGGPASYRFVTACDNSYGPVTATGPSTLTFDAHSNLCTSSTFSGTFSATVSGFTAAAIGTPFTASEAGATGTLPAGAVVVASNTGATGAYCRLGAVSDLTGIYIAGGGGWFAYTVGVSTQLSCKTAVGTGNTIINMVGGAGLPTGTGGGGGASGGGGGVVTQGTVPWLDSVTTWGGGTLGAMGSYGTSPGAVLVPGVNAFVTNTPTVNQGTSPWVSSVTNWAGQTLGTMAFYGSSPGAVLVPGVNAFVTNTINAAVTQTTSPWVTSVSTWAAGTLGAMANYGTSPGAVLVPGVNAFVTNAVAVTQSSPPWVSSITTWGSGTLGAMANYGTSPGTVLVPGVNAFVTNAASIGGGTPFTTNSGTPLVLNVAGTSTSGAIPTGSPTTTAIKIANLGGVAVSCNYGVGSATAAANQDTVQPGGSIVRGVGSNTFIACIDLTGTTSNAVVVQSGTGVASDMGGNPSSQSNLGTTPGAIAVPAVNAYEIGSVSYGSVSAALGIVATQIGISDGGTGCAGGACLITPTALVPGTFGTPSTQVLSTQNNDPCSYAAKSSKPIAISTATTTNLVPISGTTTIYVCGFSMTIAPSGTAAATALFEYGTGATCGTGTVTLTGTYGNGDLTSAAPVVPISYGAGGNTVFTAIAANGLCILTAGTAVSVQGILTYVQQ